MSEQNKFNEIFGDMASELNNFSIDLQSPSVASNNNQSKNDTEYYDKYADFTEIEDEHGNILLIKYCNYETEYRGNKYCKYVLCDEKTDSMKLGIAQIKGGQHVRLEDEERVQKIMEHINNELRTRLADYIKLKSHSIHSNLVYMGYSLDNLFKNPSFVFYQEGHSEFIYIIDIYNDNGTPGEFPLFGAMLKELKRNGHTFIKNVSYKIPDKDSFYNKTFNINGKIVPLKYIDSYKIADDDEVLTLYKVVKTDKFVVLVEDENGDISVEDDIDHITSVFDDIDETKIITGKEPQKIEKKSSFSLGSVVSKFFKK